MSLTEQELLDKIAMVEKDISSNISNIKHLNILSEYKEYLQDELKQIRLGNNTDG